MTAALLSAGALAACSGDGEDGGGDASAPATADGGEALTLSVVSLIPGTEEAAFAAFDEQVAQFEAENPDIDVEAQEYEWTAESFAADLAGGTLPDVFTIPFTDGRTLIENGQIADISAQVAELPYAGDFNPNVLAAGTDAEGTIFALPTQAYAIGLQYNRDLFIQAGLDPDAPPTTWEEVREAADAIAEATGKTGYATMSAENTGGWQLTHATYTRGGRMQVVEGDDVDVTLDNDATREALEYLRTLRWEDDSMGSTFLYTWGDINQAFAAGEIGMYTGGSDLYTSLSRSNAIDPDSYGLTAVPLSDDPDAGILGGGTLVAVGADADEATKEAAVRWIDFYYMSKLTTEEGAVLDAETLVASDQPVGTPSLPIFDQETWERNQEWISEFVNVPVEQMTGFTGAVFDQAVVAEPPANTQELYAELDTVVQAVLTDESADIDALLADADARVQALVDRG